LAGTGSRCCSRSILCFLYEVRMKRFQKIFSKKDETWFGLTLKPSLSFLLKPQNTAGFTLLLAGWTRRKKHFIIVNYVIAKNDPIFEHNSVNLSNRSSNFFPQMPFISSYATCLPQNNEAFDECRCFWCFVSLSLIYPDHPCSSLLYGDRIVCLSFASI